MTRLDRLLAARSGAPRRDVQGWIRSGRVRVGGEVERDPARDVGEDEDLWLNDRLFPPPPPIVLYHKPVGVLSTVGDPNGRLSLREHAASILAWGLHPVGRLDADTDGLLPFSLDGALTQRLLHPKREVEKEYVAQVDGVPGEAALRQLLDGVATADGVFAARSARAEGSTVTLVVTEGKHRMVRRMLANVGFPVVALRRIRFGGWRLLDLAPGAYRVPAEDENAWLTKGVEG